MEFYSVPLGPNNRPLFEQDYSRTYALSFDSSGILFCAINDPTSACYLFQGYPLYGYAMFGYQNNRLESHGIYKTTDLGQHWTHIGLDSLFIYKLISYGDSTYALTDQGLWLIINDAKSGVRTERVSFSQPELQLFPNPSRKTMAVSCENGDASRNALIIYDESGRIMKTLLDREELSGNHTLNVDLSDLPNGCYLLQHSHTEHGKQVKSITKFVISK